MRHRLCGGPLLLLLAAAAPTCAQVPDTAPPAAPSAPDTAPPVAPVTPDVTPPDASEAAPLPPPIKRLGPVKRLARKPPKAKAVKAKIKAKAKTKAKTAPARKPPKAAASVYRPAKTPAAPPRGAGLASGAWINLNTRSAGPLGESTWVNLSQATSIRFYQAGKTSFAAVGGGSSYVSTSDPAAIQKLRAYVLAHQAK